MILLLALWGCGGTQSETAIVLNCSAMTVQRAGLWQQHSTTLAAIDAATGQMVERCRILTSLEMSGGPAAVDYGGVVLDLDTLPDLAIIEVVANGRSYWSSGGSLSFSSFDAGKAEGTYDITGQEVDLASGEPTGEAVDITGTFSWCDVPNRDDCGSRFDNTSLGKAVTLTTPTFGATPARASYCRMLVDPATGALQVDLQLGAYNGVNVAQLWVRECGGGVPVPNSLRFRAGGVSGPGSYGPTTVGVYPGVVLPDLTWSHSAAWVPGIGQDLACMAYYNPATLNLELGSDCAWEVDRAGHFSLSCDAAHYYSYGVLPWDNTGAFGLEADCDYVEVGG